MKVTRIILSVIFLVVGALSLGILVSTLAGGANPIGKFLFSSYSYLSFGIPIYYFWFFSLFFMRTQYIERLLWPVLSLIPFIFFTLAVRIQSNAANSSDIEMIFVSAFGRDGSLTFLYIVGILALAGEIFLFALFRQKRKDDTDISLEDAIESFEKEKIHKNNQRTTPVRVPNNEMRYRNLGEQQADFYNYPQMRRRQAPNFPKITPYQQSQQSQVSQELKKEKDEKEHFKKELEVLRSQLNETKEEMKQFAADVEDHQEKPKEVNSVQTAPEISQATQSVISNNELNKPTSYLEERNQKNEYVLVFNKKKNNLGQEKNTLFKVEQEIYHDDELNPAADIGAEAYISKDNLAHIDIDHEQFEYDIHDYQEYIEDNDEKLIERAKTATTNLGVDAWIDQENEIDLKKKPSIMKEVGDENVDILERVAENLYFDDENNVVHDDAVVDKVYTDIKEIKEKERLQMEEKKDSRVRISDDVHEMIDTEEEANEKKEIKKSTELQIKKDEKSDDTKLRRILPLRKKKKGYKIPIVGLLDPPEEILEENSEVLEKVANLLEVTLQEFNIDAKVISVCKGPVVTMFEILPASGVRLRRIVELSDNLALRLAAPSIRIVAPIPGKEAVGIEVPNKNRETVAFSELVASKKFSDKENALPVALGKDIANDIQIIDLAKMPHLLIAGATGSGKSVCVNAIISSLLYRCTPDEVKLLLIDPKIVELVFYNGIGHLLTPVISDAAQSLQALRWCVEEMERRYRELESLNVREIKSFNRKLKEKGASAKVGMPYIVVVIDEFADLMMTCGKEIEILVSRLTAKSRAVGIHLVVATQRPSTDVITGLIKSNIPSRISFMVASKTDSRIILDMNGAENLLGKGDMLYSSASDPFPDRLQGPYLSENEVERLVDYVKDLTGEPNYITEEIFVSQDEGFDGNSSTDDPLWDAAVKEVVRAKKASASHLQRRFKIGYNRAARLVEDMEDRGIIGPQQGSRPREVYADSA